MGPKRMYNRALPAGPGELVWVVQGKTEHLATLSNPIEPRNECIVLITWAATNTTEYVPRSSLKALDKGLRRKRPQRRIESDSSNRKRNRSQITNTTLNDDVPVARPVAVTPPIKRQMDDERCLVKKRKPTKLILDPQDEQPRRRRLSERSRREIVPTGLDVLCGDEFSPLTIEHSGNTKFRSILSSHSTTYELSASGREKAAIAKEVMHQILKSGGRFLRQVPSDNANRFGWKKMEYVEAVMEIRKSFFDRKNSKCRREVCYI